MLQKKIKKVPASIAKNNKQRKHRQEKEQRRLFFLPVFHLPEHSDVWVNGIINENNNVFPVCA